MWNKKSAELVFVSKTENEKGTPIDKEIKKIVACDEMGAWSVNYYNAMNRRMQSANNLRVNEYYTRDFKEEDIIYQLKFVFFEGRKYEVKNVLIDKQSRLKRILDIEEVNVNVKVIRPKVFN